MRANKEKNQNYEKYEFTSFVPGQANSEIKNFDFIEFSEESNTSHSIPQAEIRIERNSAAASGFKIEPMVKEHRGINRQAQDDFEKAVALEVEKRLAEVKDQAYQEGFSTGETAGREKAYAEATQVFEEKIEQFASEIEQTVSMRKDILEQSKQDAYLMVKNLTKWLVLKEIDEKYYLARLLEKLIHEINTKSNLVIRVNQEAFGYMPEVVKIVERKMGMLTNVRLEVDLDQSENGIILESENTIVDGSLETQFKSIDRIFEKAGIHDESA